MLFMYIVVLFVLCLFNCSYFVMFHFFSLFFLGGGSILGLTQTMGSIIND